MTADWTIWAFRYARSDMPRDFFGGTLVNSNKGRINNPMVYSLIHGGEAGAEAKMRFQSGSALFRAQKMQDAAGRKAV